MRRLIAVALFGMACDSPVPPIPPAVDLLMECIECDGAEMDSVVAGGQAMVPVLRDLLTGGPPTERVERMERALYLQLSDSARAPKPPLPPPQRAAVIAKQVGDFRNQYRVRAALALGAIGGPEARDALCGHGAAVLEPPVRAAVDSALVQSGGPC